jgi:hypothetical protein
VRYLAKNAHIFKENIKNIDSLKNDALTAIIEKN